MGPGTWLLPPTEANMTAKKKNIRNFIVKDILSEGKIRAFQWNSVLLQHEKNSSTVVFAFRHMGVRPA
jgi:hypothetical protein